MKRAMNVFPTKMYSSALMVPSNFNLSKGTKGTSCIF